MVGLVKKRSNLATKCLAIKTGKMKNSNRIFSKKGNVYEIIRWEKGQFIIKDELGFEHHFNDNKEFFTLLY